MSIIKKVGMFTMLLFISFLLLTPVNADAATVGQKLITPETGWQRYDDKKDSNGLIIYGGSSTWSIASYDPSIYYMGTDTYVAKGELNNQSTHYIKLKFYGT